MNEYTVVGIQTNGKSCKDCLFAGENTRLGDAYGDTLVGCQNALLKVPATPRSVFDTHYPPCTGGVNNKFTSFTYRLAHKVSGVLLTDQDMKDLVDYYRSELNE